MAVATSALIGAAAGIGGAAISAGAAGKAADAQTAAANKSIEFQKETRDIIRDDLAPFLGAGTNALAAYQYNLGLLPDAPVFGATPLEITEVPGTTTGTGGGGLFPTSLPPGPHSITPGSNGEDGYIGYGGQGSAAPAGTTGTQYKVGDQLFATREEAEAYAKANATGGTAYGGYQASPGYQFQLEQGQDSINALAGARGGLVSGRTLQDLSTFNQGVANQDFWNYMSRLGGLVDTGVSSAQMSGQASQNAAAGVGNALAGIGNANAASAIATGSAWSGAMDNLAGLFSYQNGLNPYNSKTG